MKKRNGYLFFSIITFMGLGSFAYSAENSSQPYIDRLKETLPEDGSSSGSFIEAEKKKLQEKGGSEAESSQGYTEHLRKTDPNPAGDGSESYTKREKEKLGSGSPDSAIASVKEGHSELKMMREGDIRFAAGFRIGASATRKVTSSETSISFGQVYPDTFVPELTLFAEYQPFHSEWFGNIGLSFSGGFSLQDGHGLFTRQVPKPSGGFFDLTSGTYFQFVTIPVTVGANYRFNLLRVLRPYVEASGIVIGYVESRSDSKTNYRGYSAGVRYGGGINILLDWLDTKNTWALYETGGIKHFYLNLDYSLTNTFASAVTFNVSALRAGFAYEF